jgi:hypothetical protein
MILRRAMPGQTEPFNLQRMEGFLVFFSGTGTVRSSIRCKYHPRTSLTHSIPAVMKAIYNSDLCASLAL